MTEPDALNYPTVQLRHELPDGTWHIDWLLAQDAEGAEPLIAFRLPGRLDKTAVGVVVPARRIPDHRPGYLTYEGPVSNHRGTVARLVRGLILHWTRAADAWMIKVEWVDSTGTATRQHLSVVPLEDDDWEIRIMLTPPRAV